MCSQIPGTNYQILTKKLIRWQKIIKASKKLTREVIKSDKEATKIDMKVTNYNGKANKVIAVNKRVKNNKLTNKVTRKEDTKTL